MKFFRPSQTLDATTDPNLARVQDEIEFARALSAFILAARLEEAENRAEEAYQRILRTGRFSAPRKS